MLDDMTARLRALELAHEMHQMKDCVDRSPGAILERAERYAHFITKGRITRPEPGESA